MTYAVNLAQGASNNVTFRNRIINGAMVIDQRNAGAAISPSGNVYCVDRWVTGKNGGATVSAQQSSTAPTGFTKSQLYSVTTGATTNATDYNVIQQAIEGYNVADLGWGAAGASSVTLSFWVRCSLTGTFGVTVRTANSALSYVASYSISSANTWEYKTIVVPGVTTAGSYNITNGTGLDIQFDLGVGTTYSSSATGAWQSANYLGLTGGTKLTATTGATFYLTGVQLEAGTTASPFEYRQYGQELALCQRYYEKSFAQGTAPAYNQSFNFSTGTAYVGTSLTIPIIPFKVTKRAAPTMTFYGVSNSGWRYYAGGFSNLSSFSGTAQDSYFYGEGNGLATLTVYQSTICGGNWTAEAEL